MAPRQPGPLALPLPGERRGRRSFILRAAGGLALLAAGGGTWLGLRATRPAPDLGPLRVFDAAQATVMLAIADRLVPPRDGFPRPADLRLAARMDGIAAMAHPATQAELRQLIGLFESALTGLLLHGHAELFTAAPPARQDARLRAWADSRLALGRTGYRGLKRLVYAAYYASPETWPAVGYPGPPLERPSGRAG